MTTKHRQKKSRHWGGLGAIILFLSVLLLCICVGSVNIPAREALETIWNAIQGTATVGGNGMTRSIILYVRLPRVLCVACAGAALSLCGAAMQGLLRNPLADGSTLGVSSGASLGAVIAIAFGIAPFPSLPLAGTTLMAMLFAFLSLTLILSLASRMDYSLATGTIILIGVVFSMFINSIISLIISFSHDKINAITFWTMGSLSGSGYADFLMLLVALLLFGTVLLRYSAELDAFAIGEENARHIGVDVKRVKLIILIAVSALIGVCVSVGGTIGFVGLVAPHITRMIVGPAHKRLLPAALLFGSVFLLLSDLVSRILLNPLELPIGVVTSFIGAIVFVYIFYRARKVA